MKDHTIKYAGIGSIQTPEDILEMFLEIGGEFANRGYILRSGGAVGADTMFEIGCKLNDGYREIFLPWKNFNNNKSEFYDVSPQAESLASQFHPKWSDLEHTSRSLIARNSFQVLGKDLNDPVDFIVCWTENGDLVGGTAQALRIAKHYQIPVYNFGNGLTVEDLYSSVACLETFK